LKALHFVDVPYPHAAFLWFLEPTLETIEVLAENCNYRSTLHYHSFVGLTGSGTALSQIRHLDIGGATMTNRELQRLIVGCSSAIRIAFSASSSDESRTGILRHIRLNLRDRLRFSGENRLHLTLVGWIGVGRTNEMALAEYNKLKKVASSSPDERNLWF